MIISPIEQNSSNGQKPATATLHTFSRLGEAEQRQALALLEKSRNGTGTADSSSSEPAELAPVAFAELVARRFPRITWAVEGMIAAGNLVVLGGRPKSGKSWLGLQLVMAVDTGQPFLGMPTTPLPACYIALEDGERRVYERAHLLRWQPKRAGVLFDIARFDGRDGTPGPGVEQIRQLARRYQLIVIDTLIGTLSGAANENDNAQIGAIANALAGIAHDTDCAIVVVHHTGKSPQDDIFGTLRGASALRGAYDVGLILERKQQEREAVLHAESRDLEIENKTIQQAPNGAGWAYVGAASVLSKIRGGRAGVELLTEHGDGATVGELAEASGRSEHGVRSALQTAESRGLVRQERSAGAAKKPAIRWFLVAGAQ